MSIVITSSVIHLSILVLSVDISIQWMNGNDQGNEEFVEIPQTKSFQLIYSSNSKYDDQDVNNSVSLQLHYETMVNNLVRDVNIQKDLIKQIMKRMRI
jgi:hypothetical protein